MATQRYTVTPHPIDTLLTWVKSGEIAIPEIQRPFVWEATKVRNLLDSLYRGYPIGYLISWRNPTVRLKDGTSAAGKRVLIDGQQRVTALMAALLGYEVVNSAGAELSQADFAMSKIASNDTYGGNELRKAVDYFCHLAVAPEFYGKIKENDTAFARTEYFQKMAWLKNESDDIYDPSYTDM